MDFHKNISGTNCIINMSGKFTFSDHASFRNIIDLIKDRSINALTLNLSELEYVDSAALGMLLIAREEAGKHNFKITLLKPKGHVMKMFQLSKFDTLFTISD